MAISLYAGMRAVWVQFIPHLYSAVSGRFLVFMQPTVCFLLHVQITAVHEQGMALQASRMAV